MATRGTPLPAALIRQARELRRTMGYRAIARLLGLSTRTVRKYTRTSRIPLPHGTLDADTGRAA